MAARKILGALIIVFLGIPVLFGITWAVGLVRASVSSQVLFDLPRKIIAEIPDTADAIFEAAQNDPSIKDPDVRAWFKAAAKTGTTPRDLMEKTGILSWMQDELSESLRQMGKMLRGEVPIRTLYLDMRPLKQALRHPDLDRFLEGTLANLPPCDEQGLKEWMSLASTKDQDRDLPACRPDLPLAKDVFFLRKSKAIADIEDSVPIFEDVKPFPFPRFGIAKVVALGSYFLFLIPAAFILVGVLIASQSRSGRLLWSGVSVLAGSLPVLIISLFAKTIGLWALEGGGFSWRHPWTSDFGRMALDKLSWIPSRFIDAFFTPVIWTAAVVALMGVVLLALSASARARETKPQQA